MKSGLRMCCGGSRSSNLHLKGDTSGDVFFSTDTVPYCCFWRAVRRVCAAIAHGLRNLVENPVEEILRLLRNSLSEESTALRNVLKLEQMTKAYLTLSHCEGRREV